MSGGSFGRERVLTAGDLAGWASRHHPDVELAFVFTDGDHLVWRYARDLGLALLSEGDPEHVRPLRPVIEIDIEGEFGLIVG